MKFVKMFGILVFIAVSALLLSGCTLKNKGTYIIQKQSMFEPSRWDDVIDVYGFADDYSVARDIAKYLEEDGGSYKIISK
jgi:hypothetical protein